MRLKKNKDKKQKKKRVKELIFMGEKLRKLYIMTGAGVPNDEFCNLAPEEGIYGIQFDEFRPESSHPWNSESSGIQLGHSVFPEHSSTSLSTGIVISTVVSC